MISHQIFYQYLVDSLIVINCSLFALYTNNSVDLIPKSRAYIKLVIKYILHMLLQHHDLLIFLGMCWYIEEVHWNQLLIFLFFPSFYYLNYHLYHYQYALHCVKENQENIMVLKYEKKQHMINFRNQMKSNLKLKIQLLNLPSNLRWNWSRCVK